MQVTREWYREYLRKNHQPEPEWLQDQKGEKKNKFNAKKVHLDGYIFDSKIEAAYYVECRWMLCAGLIRDLWVHTRFPLIVNNELIGHYTDDVDFVEIKTETWKVVDVKSEITRKLASYQKNRKHMMEQYQIDIMEIVR